MISLSRPRPRSRRLSHWFKRLRAGVQRRLALRRSRLALARLDMRLLDDVALTSRQQQQEAARRLWDAPDSWRNHGSGWR